MDGNPRDGARQPSAEQLELDFAIPPIPNAAPSRNALFFAVLPTAEAASRMTDVRRDLRAAHGLSGSAIAASRMHVSLLGFNLKAPSFDRLVAVAKQVGGALRAPAFEARFTRALSFKSKGRRPLVLGCRHGADAGLRDLRGGLEAASRRIGVRGARPSLTPHVTIAYDAAGIPDTTLETPVCWTVREFVLVLSEQGRGRHTHLARWPLDAAA
jgi:2'-5' RNA ligase